MWRRATDRHPSNDSPCCLSTWLDTETTRTSKDGKDERWMWGHKRRQCVPGEAQRKDIYGAHFEGQIKALSFRPKCMTFWRIADSELMKQLKIRNIVERKEERGWESRATDGNFHGRKELDHFVSPLFPLFTIPPPLLSLRQMKMLRYQKKLSLADVDLLINYSLIDFQSRAAAILLQLQLLSSCSAMTKCPIVITKFAWCNSLRHHQKVTINWLKLLRKPSESGTLCFALINIRGLSN